MIFFSSMLLMLLFLIILLLPNKNLQSIMFLSKFECGKETQMMENKFSYQFFCLMVIFLVFDLELLICLLFNILAPDLSVELLLTCYLFILIILLSSCMEWIFKSIEWL